MIRVVESSFDEHSSVVEARSAQRPVAGTFTPAGSPGAGLRRPARGRSQSLASSHRHVVLLTGGSDESQSLVSESMSARSHRREHWKTKWTVAPAEVLTPSETEKENESGPHTSVCMLTWADSTSGGDTGARHAVRQVPLLQIVRLALVSQSSTSSHQAHVPLGGDATLQKRREPVIGLDGHG